MFGPAASGDCQEFRRQRRACWITGTVQGVGFRPFVHRSAVNLQLTGFVRNESGRVYLEVEGSKELLDQFAHMVVELPPPLSRIDSVRWQDLPWQGSAEFRIELSVADSAAQAVITPDAATCRDCLRELFDPDDRRYLYPFINCMNCGPRLTIIRGAPYDRVRTTMVDFEMCVACRHEYEDPANRRFHAQPIACRDCGPRLTLLDNVGMVIPSPDPLQDFSAAICAGRIGALKGLGGFHLVCDAQSDQAVSELRRRKHRDQKPFALMVAGIEQAKMICRVDSSEEKLLRSAASPIVLLHREEAESCRIASAVAPGNPCLGLMLPYTPLHHLLMRAVDMRPLVMTSGNSSDEPMAYTNDDVIARLGPIVDLILTHNRTIHVRCDDSVARVVAGRPSMIRRSRGFAPEPVSLPCRLPYPMLAVGGQQKGTFALGREGQAFVSHHLGDLDHLSAYLAFERDLRLYEEVFDIRPKAIVHDLHPDYSSTGYAQKRSSQDGLKTIAVQHHHAHIASAMAEHQRDGPVIGVAFDGTGYGIDGAIWGGEFLISSYAGFHRAAHLRSVGLPGGDAAVSEPWRCAAAHLRDAGCDLPELFEQFPAPTVRMFEQMITRRVNTPWTSSMGRLFDAVSALSGVRSFTTYEGQAAIELEFLAATSSATGTYPFEVLKLTDSVTAALPKQGVWNSTDSVRQLPEFAIDTRPLIRAIVDDLKSKVDRPVIARRFHSTIAEMVVQTCRTLKDATGLARVVLTGGVFMNVVLCQEVTRRLLESGFEVYQQSRLPCNDGGLSFGQLCVAAAQESCDEQDVIHVSRDPR